MKNNILYFPYINLPNNDWAIKSILYWDTIGTIVPTDYRHNPEGLTDFMREAVQTGHIVQHFTSEYEELQSDVDEKIIQLLESPSFPILEARANLINGFRSRIHAQKFSWHFFKKLVAMKVAVKDGTWYWVESKIALMMMTKLATAIAKDIRHIASTDLSVLAQESNLIGLTENDSNKIRSYILNEVMPYPKEVELSTLIRFKDKYYEQLKRFRLSIDEVIWTLSGIADDTVRKNLLRTKIEQINDNKDELTARLDENKFRKIAYGSFKGMLVDVGISLVFGDPITPGVTILSTINEIIKEYNGNPIKNEDLAYLALLDQRL